MYWRLHYHFIWATRERRPLITSRRQVIILRALFAKARDLRLTAHAIGAVEDHLHVVASMPPTLSVSECVKNLKGASSRAVNKADDDHAFRWQEGYGALTVGGRSLSTVIEYVRRQKQHHQFGTTFPLYERLEEEGPKESS